MKNYLEFEKEIKDLDQQIEDLKSPFGKEGLAEVDTGKIKITQDQINIRLEEIYKTLVIKKTANDAIEVRNKAGTIPLFSLWNNEINPARKVKGPIVTEQIHAGHL